MKQWIFISLAVGSLACTAASPAPGSAIEASELAARLSRGTPPAILDVRTRDEYTRGHIPGALNVPHTELGDRLTSLGLDPGDEVVVHCERGGRAAAAEEILREAGHTNVRDLSGHMEAWRAGGFPLE